MIYMIIIWVTLILCTVGGNMILGFYISHQQIEERILKNGKYILYFMLSLCFIWPVANLAFNLMVPNEKIMIGTWGTAPFFQIIFNFFAYISGNFLAVSHYYLETVHKLADRIFCYVTIFGLTVLLLLSNVFCLFLDEGKNYSFISPDQNHTIVVNEHNFLIAGWVTVYERKNPVMVSFRCREETDDGHLPILSNDYTITWYQDSVTFSFGDGQGGEENVIVYFDKG